MEKLKFSDIQPPPKYCIHGPAIAYVWRYNDRCETSFMTAVALFSDFSAVYRYFDLLS